MRRDPVVMTRFAPARYNQRKSESPPLCPTCGQPASEALGGPDHDWECRNEACTEFGQPVRADEPPPREDPQPGAA
jgi:hypothetical protein